MSLLKRFRSSPYRIRAAGYASLGVFLAFVVMNDAALGLDMEGSVIGRGAHCGHWWSEEGTISKCGGLALSRSGYRS